MPSPAASAPAAALCITSCISSASTISITSITSPTSTHCFHHLHRLHPSPPPLTSTSPAPPPPPCAAEDPSPGSALLRWPISSCPASIPPGGLSSGPGGAQTPRTAPSTAESSSCPRLGPHSCIHLHPPPAPPAEPFGAPLSHPGLCARLEAASIPPLTSPRAELLKAAPTPPSPGRCCAGDAGDVPNARPLTAPLQWGALRCPPACWRSASPAPSWPQVSIGLRAGGTEGGSANLEGTSPTGPPRTTRSERKPPWGGSALSPPPRSHLGSNAAP